MKNAFTSLLIACCAVFGCTAKAAEDGLVMNGLAAYEQLRKEHYIGALYLPTLEQNADAVFSMSGNKRMEMRVTIERWPPRKYGKQWTQAILINNSQEAQDTYAEDILAFTSLPIKDLQSGDRIKLELQDGKGTVVSINGIPLLRTADDGLFNVILKTWIGARPPSSEFKRTMLQAPTSSELLSRYEAVEPSAARMKEIARWGQVSDMVLAATATKAVAPVVAAAPPKPVASKPVASKPAAVETQSKPPAPVVEKPAVAVVPPPPPPPAQAPAPQAAPKPEVAKAEPKPEPKPAPKPEAVAKTEPQLDPEAKRQAGLLKAYRSNVLKLTYLNTQYPKRALDLKQEGLVVLRVTVDRAGKILAIKEEQASEYNTLNKAAESAVKQSAPFPEVPDSLAGDKFELLLPFNFRISG